MRLTKTEVAEIMALIDVEEELREFEWKGASWTQDKLIAASPFREDRTPSFFVNLTGELKGVWGDSGASDDYYAKGGWFKLIAFLRGISTDEVVDEYRGLLTQRATSTDLPAFSLRLKSEGRTCEHTDRAPLEAADANRRITAPGLSYLERRGIPARVSGPLRISYDPARKAIVIPWFDAKGELVAMKYRSTRDKRFWYAPGGRPISELIYGIDRLYRRKFKAVCVVEAEIDAMSLMAAGYPAVATGGAALSREKIDLLRSGPAERLVIVPDADAAGERWAGELERELKGYAEVRIARVGAQYGVKDVNDVLAQYGVEAVRGVVEINFTGNYIF